MPGTQALVKLGASVEVPSSGRYQASAREKAGCPGLRCGSRGTPLLQSVRAAASVVLGRVDEGATIPPSSRSAWSRSVREYPGASSPRRSLAIHADPLIPRPRTRRQRQERSHRTRRWPSLATRRRSHHLISRERVTGRFRRASTFPFAAWACRLGERRPARVAASASAGSDLPCQRRVLWSASLGHPLWAVRPDSLGRLTLVANQSA